MAGPQQMVDIDQGLLCQQTQSLRLHAQEGVIAELFDFDPVTADFVIIGLVGSERKQMGSRGGHGTILMRGTAPAHGAPLA